MQRASLPVPASRTLGDRSPNDGRRIDRAARGGLDNSLQLE